jgi:molybdenum cofactor cytidylyltransferase
LINYFSVNNLNCYAAIILAAGFSSRMNNFKPLMTIDGETVIDRVVSTYRKNGIEVYLVTGYQQDKLIASLKNHDIHVVENPYFRLGMFSSIQAGLRCLPDSVEHFFIAPADIPQVRPFTIQRMMEKAKGCMGKIIYPEFKGTRGHPVLIPSQLGPAILGWKKEGNLKEVLDYYKQIAVEVAVPDRYILFDIDSPEDFRKLQERFSHYRVPTEEECEVILTDVAAVPENIRRHCFKVAEVADNIGQAIGASFINLDLEAIRAGALLHDILKGQPDHAVAGGQWLCEMGFSGISNIVAAHTDLPESKQGVSLEAKVVYLADKYVKEDTVIPLEERFQSAIQRFGGDQEARSDILRRRKKAFDVKDEIERLLRRLLEGVVFT